jgi:hypothetical protein
MPVEQLAYSLSDAAAAVRKSQRWVWANTSPRGPIPCVRIGTGKRQSVLYPVAELKQWLSDSAPKGGAA